MVVVTINNGLARGNFEYGKGHIKGRKQMKKIQRTLLRLGKFTKGTAYILLGVVF